MMQAETSTPGPFWMHTAESGEHQVRGRHGKIIERFQADQEAGAVALLQRLQAPLRAARQDLPAVESKLDLAREVVRLLGDDGNERRATEIAKRGNVQSINDTIDRLRARNIQ